MKNTILIILGLILIPGSSIFSQDFKFGLTAGFDIAKASVTNKPEELKDLKLFNPMITFNINGYIGFKSSGFWGLSVEPGYVQKGGAKKVDNEDKRIQLNYIQLPVLVDFYIIKKLFFSVGPELSYMINAKEKYAGTSEDINDLYDKNFEISGMAGINYTVIDILDIGLRYNHGLTNIRTISITDILGMPIGTLKVYNQYFQLIIRFKI